MCTGKEQMHFFYAAEPATLGTFINQSFMSLTILRASAGSGKTYALTLNYLQLLLKGESPTFFRSILAVTFTNKATKEMKERILSELEKLAAGETDKGMGKGLLEVLPIDAAELQKRAKAAMVEILHNYSYFSVSTIDSFFQKIVRNFAREADLPATYKIELNTAREKSKALSW